MTTSTIDARTQGINLVLSVMRDGSRTDRYVVLKDDGTYSTTNTRGADGIYILTSFDASVEAEEAEAVDILNRLDHQQSDRWIEIIEEALGDALATDTQPTLCVAHYDADADESWRLSDDHHSESFVTPTEALAAARNVLRDWYEIN